MSGNVFQELKIRSFETEEQEEIIYEYARERIPHLL